LGLVLEEEQLISVENDCSSSFRAVCINL
jgi:hypothetical protein